ncbi:MAG: acyl-[acyl-carrier-protein] thioesterase [Cellulosilyticaceae bacterium]
MARDIKKHSKTFKINYRDVDLEGNLRMSALVDYMQEVSGEHARLLGLDYSGDDNEDRIFWIVSRAKMHLETLPKWLETIRIETYPDGIDKLFAVRRFNIYNSDEEQIGYIIGNYILLDCDTHRPVRIKNLKGPITKLDWVYEGETLPKLKGPEIVEVEDSRKVRSSEIDLNHHMNNAHYIRWSVDMFTTEELNKRPIKSIQTNYITSLVEGDTAHIVRGLDEEGNTLIQGTSLDGSIVYWTSKVVLMDL